MQTLKKAILAAALVVASPVLAQNIGEVEYMDSCASCHGASGAGDGPLAELMTVDVPDLRTLSADNDGTYPLTEVIMFIDGRTGIRGHGYPMPVWGSRFQADTEALGSVASEREVRGRVLMLAEYIETLQQ